MIKYSNNFNLYITFKMNTFLHEIVISFFPTKASCAFVGEPWFFYNHTVWLAVLRLCESQCAHLIQTNSDEYEFEQHVLNLVADNLEDKQTFVVELVAGIPGGDYLLTRGWFCRSEYHQANVLCLRICGCLQWVNPTTCDFDEHIQSIMERLMLQREINSLAHDENDENDDEEDIESDDEDTDYSDRIIVAHVMIDGEIVGLTKSQLDSFIQDQQTNSRDLEDADYFDQIIVAHVMIDGEIVGLTNSQLDSFIQDQQTNSRDLEEWRETVVDEDFVDEDFVDEDFVDEDFVDEDFVDEDFVDRIIFARIFKDGKILELTKTELQSYMQTSDDEGELAYQIRCQEEDYLVLREQQKEARLALEEINQQVRDLESKLILCRPQPSDW